MNAADQRTNSVRQLKLRVAAARLPPRVRKWPPFVRQWRRAALKALLAKLQVCGGG